MTLGLFGLAIVLILIAALVPMGEQYKKPLFIAGIVILVIAVALVVLGAVGWVDVGPFYRSTRVVTP